MVLALLLTNAVVTVFTIGGDSDPGSDDNKDRGIASLDITQVLQLK